MRLLFPQPAIPVILAGLLIQGFGVSMSFASFRHLPFRDPRRPLFHLVLVAAMIAVTSAAAAFQARHPQIPSPKDQPYPGTITLHVDATNTARGIFRVHEKIPVKPGKLTLLYPKWIPGVHAPAGPIGMLAGLNVTADGKDIKWVRDTFDVYAFHLDVPKGVSHINVDFQYLSSRRGGYQMTDRMLMLDWDNMSLYPAGHYSRDITFKPSVSLPRGWKYGTALEKASSSGDTTTFKPVTYNNLVDSPMYAGQYFKRVNITPDGKTPVHMDIVADAPKYLQMTDKQVELHRALVAQTLKLFGSHHYRHYDFLFSLSDHLAGNGMEHQQSSEDGVRADYFTAWDHNAPNRDLLAHEFEHSWNGKFMRPAGLWTPNFNVPMDPSMLWSYEGMTQYWGYVLTARAGLWTPRQFRAALAMVAANYDRNRPGFEWRTLEDTTHDETSAGRAALPYRSWQMSEEYYSGGQMMWLAVDVKIRSLTHGHKSLDDYARAFFGRDNGATKTHTYTRHDVIAALNNVVKYDWAGFLHRFVNERTPPFLDGIKNSGWKLVYTNKKSKYEKEYESQPESPRHIFNFAWSIGLTMGKDGRINDVRWNGPAFKAGVSTGAKLKAVNGEGYSKKALKSAIADAKGKNKSPITLLMKYQGHYRTVNVDYHDGLQYPHLKRVNGKPDYLSRIIAPRK
jgi:predicted metalloprotease with PDZ domain